MKLLLDENLSEKIVAFIVDLFPGSIHVKTVGLIRCDDNALWLWAKEHGFVIVSKDTDFHQMSVVFGHPPKFIWLRVGNASTDLIVGLLKSHQEVIQEFIRSQTESLLVLE